MRQKLDVIYSICQIVSRVSPNCHYCEFWTITASFGEIPATIWWFKKEIYAKYVRAHQKYCQIAACKPLNDYQRKKNGQLKILWSTPGPWLLRISLVWFVLMQSFHKSQKILLIWVIWIFQGAKHWGYYF